MGAAVELTRRATPPAASGTLLAGARWTRKDVWVVEEMRILGFAGSLRRASYNRGLIRAASELAPTGIVVDMFDLAAIPLYNQDVEDAGEPPAVVALKRAISEADALLVATPEYNHGVPGVLKNAIDWASRPRVTSPLRDKAVAVVGASPGRGPRRARRRSCVTRSCSPGRA